jgi:hypothetical protein
MVMLTSGHPGGRTSLAGPARYRPNRPAFPLRLLIFLKNIFHSRAHQSRAAAPELTVVVFPATHPILQLRGSLIQRYAPSVTAPCSFPAAPAPARYAPRPCCCAPCPVPRARRGAAEIQSTPPVPHQKVVAAVDVVAAATCDLSKEILQ